MYKHALCALFSLSLAAAAPRPPFNIFDVQPGGQMLLTATAYITDRGMIVGSIPYAPISCTASVVTDSGGHQHEESIPPRPVGTLVPSSGISDANGNLNFTYFAPMVASFVRIQCIASVAPSYPTATGYYTVGTGGLVPLQASYSWRNPVPDYRHPAGIGFFTSPVEIAMEGAANKMKSDYANPVTFLRGALQMGGINDSGSPVPWVPLSGYSNAYGNEADVQVPGVYPMLVAQVFGYYGCAAVQTGGNTAPNNYYSVWHIKCGKANAGGSPKKPRALMSAGQQAALQSDPVWQSLPPDQLTGYDGTAAITLSHVSTLDTAQAFADVPPSASYFDAANLMFQAGVTTGCVQSDDPTLRQYCPGNLVTRQEMAAFLVRAITGETTPLNYTQTPYFTDVPTSNSFFPHVQKLRDLGITTGCGGNTTLFCPTDNVPRWQMAMFLIRARLTLNGATFNFRPAPYFADVPWNVEGNGQPFAFIQRLYEEHVTNGCPAQVLSFCPDNLVTRGDMASFIMRALYNQTVDPAAPLLYLAGPVYMPLQPGFSQDVIIYGVNTSFDGGYSVAALGGGVTISNIRINGPTQMTVTLTVSATASAGTQSLELSYFNGTPQRLTLPLAVHIGQY
jgi:hypothetical protein